MNRVELTGRIGGDVSVRETRAGDSYCVFDIAVSGRRRGATDWFRCTAWGQSAAFVQEYCRRGDLIGIEGRLEDNRWTDSQGTEKRSVEVRAERVEKMANGRLSEEARRREMEEAAAQVPEDTEPAEEDDTLPEYTPEAESYEEEDGRQSWV